MSKQHLDDPGEQPQVAARRLSDTIATASIKTWDDLIRILEGALKEAEQKKCPAKLIKIYRTGPFEIDVFQNRSPIKRLFYKIRFELTIQWAFWSDVFAHRSRRSLITADKKKGIVRLEVY